MTATAMAVLGLCGVDARAAVDPGGSAQLPDPERGAGREQLPAGRTSPIRSHCGSCWVVGLAHYPRIETGGFWWQTQAYVLFEIEL